MATIIALLRGINVGGRNLLAMPAVREMFEELGFDRVTTVLQSGNVVFNSNRPCGPALEQMLETETARRLGVAPKYVARTGDELDQIIQLNPFSDEAINDPAHLLVMFLKRAPKPPAVTALRAAVKGPESIHHEGRQLYIVYPGGIGRSKLTGASIEQKLDICGTARNWNTVVKLAALCK
jgi:uncharacterized protein (DUF1697 family)